MKSIACCAWAVGLAIAAIHLEHASAQEIRQPSSVVYPDRAVRRTSYTQIEQPMAFDSAPEVIQGQPMMMSPGPSTITPSPQSVMSSSPQTAMMSSPQMIAEGPAMPGPATDSCTAYYGRGVCCPPTWYVNQGVRFLNRERAPLVPNGTPLGVELQPNPSNLSATVPVISTRSPNFDLGTGYTISIGRLLCHDGENRDDYLEFTYWGLNEWDREITVNGGRFSIGEFSGGDLFTPWGIEPDIRFNTVAGFNRADTMSVRYESEINNFEWNIQFQPRHRGDRLVLHPDGRWERETVPGLYSTFLLGMRYVIYNESFAFHASGHMNNGNTLVANTSGDYLTFAQNNILALQCGGDVMFDLPRFRWGFRGKIGPAINWAHGSRIVTTTGATTDPFMPAGSQDLNIVTDGHRDKIALVAETGILASYSLRPNLILNASYDFTWLSGIALAPGQIRFDVNPTSYVGVSSTLLFQGLSLQAELTF